MLRQLARLARNVPSAGERSLAIAVYGDALDAPVQAQEAGYEGVACVDDAARALELYCDLWDATRLPWAMRWCEGLLDFVLAMQDGDGRWLNFILDWEGTPNRDGRTSVAGGGFWQARAVAALARASRTLPDTRIQVALQSGMGHLAAAGSVPSDVRALHMMAAMTLLGDADDQRLRDLLAAWSTEIINCRNGDLLMNSPHERGQPHLWGHIQEGVLADTGQLLGRDDLVAVACASADRVFPDMIRTGFDLLRTQPYDVASAVYGLSRLAAVTGRSDYAALAADARAWFDGRNPAQQPVYDRDAGRVGDGVDHGLVNTHSGAEANIVGAQALFDDATALARALPGSEVLPVGAIPAGGG